jgi:hypothetical protein
MTRQTETTFVLDIIYAGARDARRGDMRLATVGVRVHALGTIVHVVICRNVPRVEAGRSLSASYAEIGLQECVTFGSAALVCRCEEALHT